jgi:hypothetical protein
MYPYSSVVSSMEYGHIFLVLVVTTLGTNTIVLYVTDYTGVRIYLSCMLLTTLEYEYICLVCSQEQDKTNVSVLKCSHIQDKTNVSVLQCSKEQSNIFVLCVTDYTEVRKHLSFILLTTLEYGYICLVCY